MTSSETIYPDNGLTDNQRDMLLALLLEREGLLFERKWGRDEYGRKFEEFYLREAKKAVKKSGGEE